MAVTYAAFIVRYKEFEAVEQATIEAVIADVEASTDRSAWGSEAEADAAQGCKVASLLLDMAFGSPMGHTEAGPAGQQNRYTLQFDNYWLTRIARRGQLSGGGID